MHSKMNYILVGCDDTDRSKVLENLFTGFDPPVEVHVTGSKKELILRMRKKLPDVVVLHITKKSDGYFEWLKKLRKIKGSDEVPILIYTGLPGKADIPALLEKLYEKKKGLESLKKDGIKKKKSNK